MIYRPCLTLLLFLSAPSISAEIYKYVTPEGETVFTDVPPAEGAEKVDLPPITIYTPPPSPHLDSSPSTGTHPGYQEVRIVAPTNGESLRSNAGEVTVKLALRPALRSSDTVDILLDGKSVASGQSTTAALTEVDRGAHSVQAVVRDRKGKVVGQSGAVAFHVLRRTKLLPAPRVTPQGGG